MLNIAPSNMWYGTRGDHDSSIVIVGEAWGAEEENQQKPFVGSSGKLLSEMLREANVDESRCLFTNIIPDRPPNNEFEHYFLPGRGSIGGLNPNPDLIAAIECLYRQINTYPRQLIIACGNYPLWVFTNCATILKGTDKPKDGRAPTPDRPTGIGDYHGSQLYRLIHRLPINHISNAESAYRVLPIFHPAAIQREWSLRATTVHDLRTRVPLSTNSLTWNTPDRTYIIPKTVSEVEGFIANAGYALNTLALDVENSRSPKNVLTCIGLAAHEKLAITIPFVQLTGVPDVYESYWLPDEEKKILRLLSWLFTRVSIMGQNLVYDCQWLWHTLRMKPKVVFDTLIAQNLLFPGTRKDLGTLSAIYCTHHRYWKDDNHEWDTTGTLEQHLRYNCEDVVRTYEIAIKQMEVLVQLKLDQFMPFEMEKFDLAREMNERGILKSPAKSMDAGRRLVEQMQSIGARLENLVKQDWIDTKSKVPWYRSDAQIKQVLYTLLNLPLQKDRKTGRPTSGKEALASLRESFPRLRGLFDALADYGSLDTIYTTFIKARAEADGRIHSSFNPAGTATYRWSSSKNAFNRGCNMQNIPVGGEDE